MQLRYVLHAKSLRKLVRDFVDFVAHKFRLLLQRQNPLHHRRLRHHLRQDLQCHHHLHIKQCPRNLHHLSLVVNPNIL
jgi:hypothetical protein